MADLYQVQHGQIVQLNNESSSLSEEQVESIVDRKLEDFDSLPEGGTTGQVLTKTESGSEWKDIISQSNTNLHFEEFPGDTSNLEDGTFFTVGDGAIDGFGGNNSSDVDEEKVKNIISDSFEIGQVTTSYNPSVTLTKDEETGKTQLNIEFPTFGLVEPGHDYDADVFGVVLSLEGSGTTSLWERCNQNGNSTNLSQAFFDNHPIYKNMKVQTIDGQPMLRIPKFYIKNGLLTSGEFSGRRTYMISPTLKEGFHLHPAFQYGNQELNQFWLGTWPATIDSEDTLYIQENSYSYGSSSNNMGNTYYSLPSFSTRAKKRNVNGVTGFMLLNMSQYSAMQHLILCEFGNAYIPTDTRGYRGLYNFIAGLSATYWVDGVKIRQSDERIFIWKDSYTEEYVDTGVSLGSWPNRDSTWHPYNIFYDESNGIFKDYFIPKVNQRSEGYKPFTGTYHEYTNGHDVYFAAGTHYLPFYNPGIFNYYIRDDYHGVTAWLSKI